MLDLNAREQEYLMEVLENERKSLLHELHHTSTRRFGERLKELLNVNIELVQKLASAADQPAA